MHTVEILEKAIDVSRLGIGFAHGERDYAFEIRSSDDGKTWSEPAKFNSGGAREIADYKFPEVSARFFRITVFGSDRNEWANIHTIRIPGVRASSPKTSPAGATPGAEYIVTEWATDPSIAKVGDFRGASADIEGLARLIGRSRTMISRSMPTLATV